MDGWMYLTDRLVFKKQQFISANQKKNEPTYIKEALREDRISIYSYKIIAWLMCSSDLRNVKFLLISDPFLIQVQGNSRDMIFNVLLDHSLCCNIKVHMHFGNANSFIHHLFFEQV